MGRIPVPTEPSWRVITYHPQPFPTRTGDYRALEYWKSVYGENTRLEVRAEADRLERDNFMGHLRRDIPILVIPDPDCVQRYDEPLATIHKQFWDAASAVVWEFYPVKRRSNWHSQVHSALADAYWGASTDFGHGNYTPQEWVAMLNKWLDAAAGSRVRSEMDLQTLRRQLGLDS